MQLHNIIKTFTLVAIVFEPLSGYQVLLGGINLTISRFCLIFALFFLIFKILKKPKIDVSPVAIAVYGFLFVLLISTIVGGADVTGRGLGLAYSVIFYYIVQDTFTRNNNPFQLILSSSYFHIGIVIFFGFWAQYHLIYYGDIIKSLPLQQSFSFLRVVESNALEAIQPLGQFTRLALPYSEPQLYGLSCLLLMYIILFKSSNLNIGLLFILGGLLLLSGSRSPLFAGVLAFCFVLIFNAGDILKILVGNIKYKLLFQVLMFGVFSVIISIFIWVNFGEFLIDFVDLDRLFNAGESTSVHFEYRMMALNIFLNNTITEIFFGCGPSCFANSTGLLAGAHMSYLTILLEQGVFGLLFFVFLLSIYPYILLIKCKNVVGSRVSISIHLILLTIVFCGLFYDFAGFSTIWIVVGGLIGFMRFILKNKIKINS
jgi:hypothetical protein